MIQNHRKFTASQTARCVKKKSPRCFTQHAFVGSFFLRLLNVCCLKINIGLLYSLEFDQSIQTINIFDNVSTFFPMQSTCQSDGELPTTSTLIRNACYNRYSEQFSGNPRDGTQVVRKCEFRISSNFMFSTFTEDTSCQGAARTLGKPNRRISEKCKKKEETLRLHVLYIHIDFLDKGKNRQRIGPCAQALQQNFQFTGFVENIDELTPNSVLAFHRE